jgi:type VI secretion system protein
MALKLRVISDHYKALGKRSSRLFGVTGGRIGRAADNDWILPDPDRYISSHHCKVDFRAGHWVLEDTSTNGVFINGSDVPASVDGVYSLKDGDRLRLGDYEVLVSIDERQDFPADATGQIPTPARVSRHGAPAPIEDLGEELDLTDLLSDATVKPVKPAAEPARAPQPQMISTLDLGRALGIDLQPGRPSSAPATNSLTNTVPGKPQRSGFQSLLDPQDEGGRKNEDWQMQTQPYDRKSLQALTNNPGAIARVLDKPVPAPTAQPQPVERRREGSTLEPANGVEAFCRGAGIDPSALPLEAQHALLQLAGQMTREVVLGLMDTLKVVPTRKAVCD